MEGDLDIVRSFWAVELVPGKEYTTTVPIDLHLTSAVLPASAKDTTRSVVTIKFAEDDGKESKSFAIASLKLESHDSQALDIIVDEGQTVTFTVTGKNAVHLSGAFVPDSGASSDDEGLYDDEIDSDELGSDEDMGSEDDVDDVDEETLAKAQAALAAQKRKQPAQNGGDAKKAKVEAPQQPKQEKKPQQPQQKAPQQKTPQTKELSNGLKYTITQLGNGPEATKGRKVAMKYVGKLTKNGKVFDASKSPFNFVLGVGEVIKGWDLGVAGMKVGEKRTLIIPSELGYGARGAGRDIPPNSSLTFDVELLKVM